MMHAGCNSLILVYGDRSILFRPTSTRQNSMLVRDASVERNGGMQAKNFIDEMV